MNPLIVSLTVLVALAVILIWAAARAWRSRKGLVRWLLGPLASLLALLFTALLVLAAIGTVRLSMPPYTFANASTSVPTTAAADRLARGQQLASLCTGCHSSTGSLPLDGGKENFMATFPAPVGAVYATNLTPSGPIKGWSDAQVARAIREGVDNQGRPLVIMPADAFHGMSDEDVYSIVAYLRTQPPSPHQVPPRQLNVLASIFAGTGMFQTSAQPPLNGPITAPPRAATAEYGDYLTRSIGCRSCHGADLTGKSGPGPAGPNLTAIVPQWSQADFVRLFRTGAAPDGQQVDPKQMPWKEYLPILTDQDLQALYLYLHALPLKK